VLARHAVDAMGLAPPRASTVKLAVSELVTNSIEHGRLGSHERIQVLARVDGRGALRMEVRDPGPGPDPAVARSGYARAATCSLATVRRTASRASGGSRTAASPASLSTSRTSQSSPA
jgi:two-component sensor histidine kinase